MAEGGGKELMEDIPYFVVLTPEEFHWLWEDIELALQSAQKKVILKDEFGRFRDLTDYKTRKLLKELKIAFEKADKKHKCIDEANQLTSWLEGSINFYESQEGIKIQKQLDKLYPEVEKNLI